MPWQYDLRIKTVFIHFYSISFNKKRFSMESKGSNNEHYAEMGALFAHENFKLRAAASTPTSASTKTFTAVAISTATITIGIGTRSARSTGTTGCPGSTGIVS